MMRWTALLPPCGMIAGQSRRRAKTGNATTIGLNIAKSVFQVHGVDAVGQGSEFGIVAPIGRNGIEQLLVVINDDNDTRIPADARLCLRMLEAQLKS